jgi:O-antigen ligase
MPVNPSSSTRAGIWALLVVLGVVVLLPVGRVAELPVAIGVVGGPVLIALRRVDLRSDSGLRLAIVIFACYWIPALISGVAPIAAGKTWATVASTLRFLPFAVFVGWALKEARIWPTVTTAVGAVVSLWILDAYVQMTTGYSLGGAAEAERLSGIFGAGNLKLGPVLAALSPFVLLAARARFGWRGLAIAFVFMAMPILLAGSRAAWVMYALVCIAIAWREAPSKRAFALAIAGGIVLCAAMVTLALRDSDGFGARVQRTLLVLRGNEVAVDEASAGRISIWRTATEMWQANPITGVGVRGFRYAYPEYAAPHDRFVDTASDTGASHAHQIVLEILSETGAIGLVLWLAGAWFALRAWLRADPPARARALAPGIALAAMCFPLNTHFAFYSAWWGTLFWWLLSLYCAALGAREDVVHA